MTPGLHVRRGLAAVLLVAANLIVDVLYAVLDPRVRLS